MADGVFNSIIADRKVPSSLDVENLLTNAVYRVLNMNKQYTHVFGPRNPLSGNKVLNAPDPHLQLRLVAEKLCARVERRYEKLLLQQREQDRIITDRNLADIRAEYSQQLEMRRRELEREKLRLEEQYAQKDFTLRQKLELEFSEKERALEITRKSLETRLLEITMSKEHLDRIKADFHAKFAADVEMLNQEWQRIGGKKEELQAFYREEFENEKQKLLGKLFELENANATLKRKLTDCGNELYEVRSQLAALVCVQDDLKVANDRLRKEMEENYRLSRISYEADALKAENSLLKEELGRMRSVSNVANVSNSLEKSSRPSEDQNSTKINELRIMVKMMGEKITSLISERNYLRDMLLLAHKNMCRSRAADTSHLPNEIPFKNNTGKINGGHASLPSTPSTSGPDIHTIKKRFTLLDELSKTLDTTIDSFNLARSITENNLGVLPTSQTNNDQVVNGKFQSGIGTDGLDIAISDLSNKSIKDENGIVPTKSVVPALNEFSLTDKLKLRNELSRELKFSIAALKEGEPSRYNIEMLEELEEKSRSVANGNVELKPNPLITDELEKDFVDHANEVEISDQLELDVVLDKNLDSGDEIEW